MELEIEQKLDYFLNEGISSPFSYASIKTLYVFVNIDRIKVRLSGKAENSRGRFFRATHAPIQPAETIKSGKTEKSNGL